MLIRINKSEMTLPGFLHEHATRFDNSQPFNPKKVADALGVSFEQLQTDLSFLAQYRLVGTRDARHPNFQGVEAFWLTGEGESVMRQAEDDLQEELLKAPDHTPTTAVRLTAKTASWVMDKATDLVVAVIANAITKP